MPSSVPRSDHGHAFAAALESGARVRSGSFSVGGRRVAVRCLGARHWADLSGSLIASRPGGPDLALDLWDPDELGLPRPEAEWGEPVELADDAGATALAYLGEGERIGYRGQAFAVDYDRASATGSGWVDARRLLPWQRLRPWQDLFVAALVDFGLDTFHAAMVSSGGLGVLLPGESGAGKSTACIACLEAGLDFLGDDAIAVECPDGGPLGHAVHGVCKLSVEGLTAFPALALHGERYEDPLGEEQAFRIGDPGFRPPRPSAGIAAIAFPRTVAAKQSSLTPLAPAKCVAELLRYSLSLTRGRLDQTFELATRLAAQAPAFTLELGRDPAGIVALLEGLLDLSGPRLAAGAAS